VQGGGRVSVVTWGSRRVRAADSGAADEVAEFDYLFATAVRPADRLALTGLRVHLPAGEETVSTACGVPEVGLGL
jgi:hypothetical protein